MIIVLEGVDNSGKSTLAVRLSAHLGLPTIPSEGPPRYAGEMNLRLERYGTMDDVIFDRHPVISQSIYSRLRGGELGFDEYYRTLFYDRRPFLIYCDPGTRGLTGHRRNTIDTDEHLEQIHGNYQYLLQMYRAWAVEHAHINYRIGDDMDLICALTETWRQHQCSTRSATSQDSTRSSVSTMTDPRARSTEN